MSERERIEALHATGLLDSETEERFDRLTRIAASALNADIALISLVDIERQWFKSRVGLDTDQTDRNYSFCQHAIANDDFFIVDDAQSDVRFENNPLVTEDPGIRFYAGAPLRDKSGQILGTLCVIDKSPRHDFSFADRELLEDLAQSVMTEIEAGEARQERDELALINQELSHRMGNMYAHVSALISLIGKDEGDKDELVSKLRDKISILGRSQSFIKSTGLEGLNFVQLFEQVMEPYSIKADATRINVHSGTEALLSEKGIFILSLTLSELATNAIKHGGLRSAKGRLNISFSSENDRFTLVWREETPGLVTQEAKPGFGSRLLGNIVPRYVSGQAQHNVSGPDLNYLLVGENSAIFLPQ